MNAYQKIFRQGWEGWFLSVLVCMMMVYGVSGVIYFTLQITTLQSPQSQVFTAVLISNFSNAVVVIVACFVFGTRNQPAGRLWKRHLYLSLVVIVSVTVTNGLLWRFWLLEKVQSTSENDMTSGGKWAYMLAPLLVSNIFYYFQQRAQTITKKITEQEYQLLHLEQSKTRAELEALQAKINPHFLHNSLNSIASLVHDDPDRAEQMVLLLSKLFRYTTGMKNQYFNSLANELEMVQTYLDVEQVRFGDRLSYRIDLAEKAWNHVQIPQFLLQPLVENAIKHGISKVAGPGAIILRIEQEGEWLRFCIHDNGPAFPEELVAGYGLQSIQDKLRLLYGDDARLLVRNQPGKEIVICIKFERLTDQLPQAITRSNVKTEPTLS
ncbi:sensor histidine kinase [Tellurirhabdus bombi]|uniref:sensor histidine kinase n=1 Tax=Tellurirhabdus bombi TaxID=2907205 RepID=UPI001F2371BF|nr:histidine kinase [Tellurirhabdus bombi]